MVYIKINELLKKKGKTKYWLIKNTEMQYQTLSKIINNETTSIRFDTLEKICNTLECDIADILEIKKD